MSIKGSLRSQDLKWDLKGKVLTCLKQDLEKKFTAREIADWILKTYPKECEEKRSRSQATIVPLKDDATLSAQIGAEIGASFGISGKNRDPTIKTIEERPRKYYYTESTDSEEIDLVENINLIENTSLPTDTNTFSPKKLTETDLYPLLSVFLKSEFEMVSHRIDERKSHNSRGTNGNKWLYPDLVSIEDLSRDWADEIKNCVQQRADKKTRLWSFEVKILINGSNIRESFFQTVSNSSWANFGYLVVKIIEGSNTLKELRMLSSLHGIGVIRLDADNPTESEIIIPAREKPTIDWDIANRLAQENKDFVEYMKVIRRFYQTGELSQFKTN